MHEHACFVVFGAHERDEVDGEAARAHGDLKPPKLAGASQTASHVVAAPTLHPRRQTRFTPTLERNTTMSLTDPDALLASRARAVVGLIRRHEAARANLEAWRDAPNLNVHERDRRAGHAHDVLGHAAHEWQAGIDRIAAALEGEGALAHLSVSVAELEGSVSARCR